MKKINKILKLIMEVIKNYFAFTLKFFTIHASLYPFTYIFDIMNFTILLSKQFKSFFITLFILEGLVIIFLLKLMGIIRSGYKEMIKCNLTVYCFLSFITLIFVIIEYFYLFKFFNKLKCSMEKPNKIILIAIGIIYHLYNNSIFIYESIIIQIAIKKHLESQRNEQTQQARNVNININQENHDETRSSYNKHKKVDSFVKEDTVYIIKGNFKENSITYDKKDNTDEIKNYINNYGNTERHLKSEILEINIKNNNKDIYLEVGVKKDNNYEENNKIENKEKNKI